MIIIGKIKEIYSDEDVPSIQDLMRDIAPKYKSVILAYLRSQKEEAFAPGFFKDVLTGERIPEEPCCYSDGKYAWRSDTIYYFEKYNIKLPDDFIEHVLSNIPSQS